MIKFTPIPSSEKISEDFKIKINGIKADPYTVRVSAMPFNCIWPGHQRTLDQTEEAAVISYGANEPAEFEVEATRDFEEAVIRPLSDNVKLQTQGRKITFTIDKPGQYVLELDGFHKPLTIFADPIEDFDVSGDNVICFGKGVHHPGCIELKSNQTLYIERGAVVYGSVLAINAENISIKGFGILDGSWEKRDWDTVLVPADIKRRNPEHDIYSPVLKKSPVGDVNLKGSVLLQNEEEFRKLLEETKQLTSCIHLYHCKNVEIKGVTLRDSSGFTVIVGNCENFVCDNIKLIGMWRYNSDGIDIFNSRNCTIKNCFLRNFDDCVVLKGIPGWDTWNMENIIVENCVIWCDWGGALEIGAETNADEYRNIIFHDCDCIHIVDIALRVHNCDRAHIHHLIYDNIRIEYSKYYVRPMGQVSDDAKFVPTPHIPYALMISFEKNTFYSNAKVKGKVTDVLFKDIQIIGDGLEEMPPVLFESYDAEHNTDGVIIENLTKNGEKITEVNPAWLEEFTKNVIIK